MKERTSRRRWRWWHDPKKGERVKKKTETNENG